MCKMSRANGRRRAKETVPKSVQIGGCDAATDRSMHSPYDRSPLGRILAYKSRCLTTAYMKGLYRVFSGVKRKADGNRAVKYMTDMLYIAAGKLTIPCC